MLPDCSLPIKASFEAAIGEIKYRVILGSGEWGWRSATESKRWKAVYQYATQGLDPKWDWGPPIEGRISCD